MIVSFFALFILEGLGPDFGWQDSLSHLFSTLVVLSAAIVAWKWPKIGGLIFVAVGIALLFMLFKAQWLSALIIGGVPLLTGGLFLLEGFKKKK